MLTYLLIGLAVQIIIVAERVGIRKVGSFADFEPFDWIVFIVCCINNVLAWPIAIGCEIYNVIQESKD